MKDKKLDSVCKVHPTANTYYKKTKFEFNKLWSWVTLYVIVGMVNGSDSATH